jgi:uncharacterized protein (DUF849 family)
MHMKRTADRLFGDNYRWSVLGAGRAQMPVAAAIGGNVRVGLEDIFCIGAGKLAASNADQVTQSARSSKGWAWRSRPPMKRARFWNSRAAIRSRSDPPSITALMRRPWSST